MVACSLFPICKQETKFTKTGSEITEMPAAGSLELVRAPLAAAAIQQTSDWRGLKLRSARGGINWRKQLLSTVAQS